MSTFKSTSGTELLKTDIIIDLVLNGGKKYKEVTQNPQMVIPIKQKQVLVEIEEEDEF